MTPNEFIKANGYEWQPSFNGAVSETINAYRGALIIEEGKKLSETKVMPPKAQAKQVIMLSEDETAKFFACEMESFTYFKKFFERYKALFTPNSVILLYVIDLDAGGVFEYEGIKFNAFVLDESSVWNEVLDFLSLEKNDLKKLSSEKKLEVIFDELATLKLDAVNKTYDEMKALIGDTKKSLMGAV